MLRQKHVEHRSMTHRNVVRFFSTALVAALALGCHDNTPNVGPSVGLLQVNPPFAGIDQGTTTTLTASLNGTAVPVTWESSDATVATVSATGVVTGVAAGRASVTATKTDDAAQVRSASISVLAVIGIGLTSGVAVTGVTSGTMVRSQGLVYHIAVPAGATGLTVTFTGGTGDGDIYVQKGTPPDDSKFPPPGGCASGATGNAESCTVTAPAAGTWYIFVAVWDPYAGGTLTATVTP
jgi:Bacterial pre-peptidase C-terminal domain/Bacterial Ig-like domain (group 2)